MRGFPMVTLLPALLAATPGTAHAPPPMTLIKAARLIEPRTGIVLSPAAVLIEDGRIQRVGTPARVRVRFVMKGGQIIPNDLAAG